MGGVQPDTGRNVNGLKNTVSLLVETRGVGIGRAHIQRRVHTQVTAMTSALRSTAERAQSPRRCARSWRATSAPRPAAVSSPSRPARRPASMSC